MKNVLIHVSGIDLENSGLLNFTELPDKTPHHAVSLQSHVHNKSIDPVRKVANYHGIATAVVTDAVPGCELWLNKIFPLATNITSGFPSNKRLLLY